MNDFPPCTIFLFSEDYQTDDCSELTGPCEGDEASRMEEEGDFSRIMSIMDNSLFAPPQLSSDSDRILVDADPLDPKEEKREKLELTKVQVEVKTKRKKLEEKQELLRLRLQTAKQNKMLNLLSSKLTKYQRENQNLKAKEALLKEELAHARDEARSSSSSESNAGESMRMLLNTNVRLLAENDRLRELLEGARTKFDRGVKRADEDIGKLRQEQKRLEEQIARSARNGSAESNDSTKTSLTSDSATGGNICQDQAMVHAAIREQITCSARNDGAETAKTLLTSESTASGNLHQDQNVARAVVNGSRLRHPSTKQHFEKFGFFLSVPTSKKNILPSTAAKYVQKEVELKDDCGGTSDKVTNTVGEKVTSYNKSEGLRVDIIERRRYYPAAA